MSEAETALNGIDLERGESVVMNMGDDVLVIERRPRRSDWEVGDVVQDRESDGEEAMIVVNVSDELTKEVTQGGINIAEANKNYPEDDTAVYCIYRRNILDSIATIPEPDVLSDLFQDGKFRVLDVKAYAFPSTRITEVEESEEDEDEE